MRTYRALWLVAVGSGVVLLAILILHTLIASLPGPFLVLVLILVLVAVTAMLFGLSSIAFAHPISPRVKGGVGSARFWLLFLTLLLAPVGLLLLPAEWNDSHAWAIIWGTGGFASATVAYFAGRPWPAYK